MPSAKKTTRQRSCFVGVFYAECCFLHDTGHRGSLPHSSKHLAFGKEPGSRSEFYTWLRTTLQVPVYMDGTRLVNFMNFRRNFVKNLLQSSDCAKIVSQHGFSISWENQFPWNDLQFSFQNFISYWDAKYAKYMFICNLKNIFTTHAIQMWGDLDKVQKHLDYQIQIITKLLLSNKKHN